METQARRGLVVFELDRPRTFRLNLNVLSAVEELAGKPLGMDEVVELMKTPRGLRRALWASFRKDDPAITEDQVGDLIDQEAFESLASKVGQATKDAMGDVSASGEKKAPAPIPTAGREPVGTGTGQSA